MDKIVLRERDIQQIVNLSFSSTAQRGLTLVEELMYPALFICAFVRDFYARIKHTCTVVFYNHFELKRNIKLFSYTYTTYDMVSIIYNTFEHAYLYKYCNSYGIAQTSRMSFTHQDHIVNELSIAI